VDYFQHLATFTIVVIVHRIMLSSVITPISFFGVCRDDLNMSRPRHFGMGLLGLGHCSCAHTSDGVLLCVSNAMLPQAAGC